LDARRTASPSWRNRAAAAIAWSGDSTDSNGPQHLAILELVAVATLFGGAPIDYVIEDAKSMAKLRTEHYLGLDK
jgi:hypothetical protein